MAHVLSLQIVHTKANKENAAASAVLCVHMYFNMCMHKYCICIRILLCVNLYATCIHVYACEYVNVYMSANTDYHPGLNGEL